MLLSQNNIKQSLLVAYQIIPKNAYIYSYKQNQQEVNLLFGLLNQLIIIRP